MTDNNLPVVTVVVAAGSGSRLGASVPKALVELAGVSLVRRAVDSMIEGGATEIVVTIPPGHEDDFARVLAGTGAILVHGGDTRQESVRRGLAALTAPDDAVVLVHDAARALVPAAVVRGVVDAIRSGADAAIPVTPVIDSIRCEQGHDSSVVDRTFLRAVQTPQGALLGVLKASHERIRAEGIDVTDDASACEHSGHRVELVAGHRDAMKITEPVDLIFASALLAERAQR